MPREKLLKNLQENNALGQIEDEILLGKTLAFLTSNATVEIVTPDEGEALLEAEDDATQPESIS